MTEQINTNLDINVSPLVQIVLGNEEHTVAWSDLVADGNLADVNDPATIADDDMVDLALRYFDADNPGNLTVTRPETGNILIAPKAQYGQA